MQVDIKNLESPKNAPVAKSKKPITMNAPPKLNMNHHHMDSFEEKPNKNYFLGHLPDELKDNVKHIVLRGMSLPVKNRAPILQYKLANSDYINKYLNKYLILDNLAMLNDHAKFGLVYGFNVLETLMIDMNQLKTPETKTSKPENKMPKPENKPESVNLDNLNPNE